MKVLAGFAPQLAELSPDLQDHIITAIEGITDPAECARVLLSARASLPAPSPALRQWLVSHAANIAHQGIA